MLATCRFNFSNASWRSVVQVYSFFRRNSGLSGADDSASAGKYLWRLCIKDFNRFSVRGSFSASMGSVFLISGVTPVCVILYPSHSHFYCAKLHFVNFNDIFSLSNFLKNFSTVAICSISDPFVTNKM